MQRKAEEELGVKMLMKFEPSKKVSSDNKAFLFIINESLYGTETPFCNSAGNGKQLNVLGHSIYPDFEYF